MIGQTVSHYRILETLGEGGMGVVYLGEDTHLGRRVAIKFLSTTSNDHHYRARFLREARAASMLSHPHIAAIYDYGEASEGQPFIVMELVKGETLNDLLSASALNLPRAIEIVEAVADALGEAHTRGIVHRDIKPSNIIINERGKVKVLDFGLAKQIHEDRTHKTSPDAQTLLATQTRSGVIVGTPLYLSPEQATGASVDGRSDLFALGAVLYECIAGRPAFSGTSVIEIGAQVIHINPPPPSSINPRVTPELDRITMKALAKKPEERYQSGEELIADLRGLRDTHSDDTRPIKRVTSPSVEMRASALTTITDSLKERRFSIISLLVVVVLMSAAVWGVARLLRPAPHKPTAEAERWYKTGTSALRDGAYYQASKALERAVQADDKFAMAHARLAEAWTELDYTDKAKDEMLRVSALVTDRSVLPEVEALYLDAVRATVSRDFPRAIESYSKITNLSPAEPEAYVDLGRAYEKFEQGDKAIENYREATNRDPQYATAFLRLAILYSRNQDTGSASATLDKADALYQSLGNVEGRTEVVYQRALLLRNTGKTAEAKAQFQQALEMARATGNELQKINALMDLSQLSFVEGATAKAQQYAREAVEFAQQRGLENLATGGLINLGYTFLGSGDYGEAEKYFKQALDFAQRNKARLREAICLLNLGGLYIQQLRTDEGLPLVEHSLAFFRQGNYSRYISLCLTQIGRANRQKGNYEAALQAFQQKLELARQGSDQAQIASSYGEIGSVLVEQERYPEALAQYDESYTINKALGNRLNLAYNLHNRGNILWRLGRYKEAGEALGQALEIASQPGSDYKPLLAEIYMSYAEMALSERRFKESEAKARQALDAAGTQYTSVAVKAKYTLALAQALSGAKREARSLGEEAVAMATRAGDAALLSSALLALAEIALETGDAEGALENAVRAQARFSGAGQQESEWRAWVVEARASGRKADEAAAQSQQARAANLLSELRQKWGAEAFNSYLARLDIQLLSRELGEAVTTDTASK
jgi:serine/threonine protein kinase/tetratricopeptide (TPR) repeat protein